MLRGQLAVVLCLWVCVGSLCGCQGGLFPQKVARSPYERYLALRGLEPPAMQENPYGRQRPALRQRLRPLDRPW